MCGITGFLSPNFSENHLQKMTDAVAHRGPDAAGYFFEVQNHLGLGHRRLSILDLSEAANQPFHSHDGRYIMVFNGEVYNYREIRAKLPSRYWKTDGDTEVVIEAFAEWGPKAVEQFNGMFAFAIWDRQEKALWFFRDRLGIKPLYYFQQGNELLFASEMKSILAVAPKQEINAKAVYQFLHVGYIPQEESIYQRIHKFPAGHYGKFQHGNWEMTPYWSPEKQLSPTLLSDEREAKKQLHDLLLDAVRLRMIADVPLGTFLSGGIDSSMVTALAQHLSDRPIKTFSIGFQEQTHNESKFAEQVAKHLKTEHHAFILSEQDALEKVDHLLNYYDQPFADSSALPTLLVSEMARKHVTVALSGDGGDEQFMGYGMYQWAKRLSNPLVQLSRPFLKAALELGDLRMQRAASLFGSVGHSSLQGHIFSQEQYLFSDPELQRLLKPGFQRAAPLTMPDKHQLPRKVSAAEYQALFDLKHYLKDDLLVKVDIASMRHSLEVRVPLLDHRLIAFSLNLDEKLKLKGKTAKYLLKQVLYDYVPAPLFDRPKWGFSIPLGKWLQGDLRYLMDYFLSKDLVETAGFVHADQVEHLQKAFFSGKTFLYNRLWTLILLHKWWKENYKQ